MAFETTKVRRGRPGAMRMAFVLLLTALMLCFCIANTKIPATQAVSATGEQKIARETELPPLEAHFVCLAACATVQEARIEAARNMPGGGAGYILEEDGWLVLGAGFDTLGAAQRAAQQLEENRGIAATVYSRRWNGAVLRITATQADFDAVCAADTALRALFSQMNRVAADMEHAGLSHRQACSLMAVLAHGAEQSQKAIQAVAGWQQNRVTAQMEVLLGRGANALGQLAAAQPGEDLSFAAAIRCAAIELRINYLDFLQALA